MITGKALAYHGIKNSKYAPQISEGTYGTPVDMKYSKAIAFNAVLDAQEVYADNRLLLRVPSDQGYDGTYGTTARDDDFESAAGMSIKLQNGIATVKLSVYKRFAHYYEVEMISSDNTPYTVKCWAYAVEFGKPNENNATDTTQVTIGEYTYPIRIYGDFVIDASGTKHYTDANGMEKVALIYRALPFDPGYATFGDAVPKPQMKNT